MRIKLDENIDHRFAIELTDLGHDADSAASEGLLSRPDSDIAAAAAREQRVVFTLDLDFSDARRFPPGSHPGIVVLRPTAFGLASIRSLVLGFLNSHTPDEISGAIVIVEPGRTRVRPSSDPE